MSLNYIGWACVALSIVTSASGCGSDVETNAPDDGIKGTAIDTYNFPPTEMKVPVPKDQWSAIGARVLDASGDKSFPGTLDDQGNLLIPDVPQGTYWLSLASHNDDLPGTQDSLLLVENTSRTIDVGTKRSHRQGLERMTQPSILRIEAPLTLPWHTYTDDGMGNVQPLEDALQIFSRSTAIAGFYFASGLPEESPPADGATSLAGWKVDAFAALAYSDTDISQFTPKDDLVILHDVSTQVDEPSEPDGSPWKSYTWSSVRESFVAPPITLTDGGSAVVTGTFKPVTQKTFSLDYRGSAFNQAILTDAPSKTPSSATFSFNLIMEPGTPVPNQGSDATLLDFVTFSFASYENPDCNPNACDLMLCTTGCATGASIVLPGDHAHSYSYGNPFDYGQELVSVSLSFNTNVSHLLKEENPNRLRGVLSVSMPASEVSGKPITPVVSLPRSVLVSGKSAPVDAITTGVGATPTIEFQAPSTGEVDVYYIRIVQLDDIIDNEGNPTSSRTVLTMATKGTKVTIPGGVLQNGKHYYAQVAAHARPGYDPAQYFVYPRRISIAQTYTGMFMP